MKRILAVVIVATAFLSGCGTDIQTNSTAVTSGKKYLASNIIFNKNLAPSALKADSVIDTTTQISAANVILDNNGTLGIDSQNVQDAFEQTTPNLNEVIVGSWALTELNTIFVSGSADNFTKVGGILTFNSDGTFTILGVNPKGALAPLVARSIDPQISNITLTYQITEDSYLSLKQEYDFTNTTTNQVTHDAFIGHFAIYKSSPNKISAGPLILKRES